jgi:metal-sulfur cluster biosynthetic enzyme
MTYFSVGLVDLAATWPCSIRSNVINLGLIYNLRLMDLETIQRLVRPRHPQVRVSPTAS